MLDLLINLNKDRRFEGSPPTFIFQRDLAQCQYNFIQSLNNLHKVG